MATEYLQDRRLQRSTTTRLIISALILLLLALGFNALLSLNSLEKLYVESIASQYGAIGKDLQRNIESALRFGKSIDKYVGIDALLDTTLENLTKDYLDDAALSGGMDADLFPNISISIVLPDGEILYSTDAAQVGTTLPAHVQEHYTVLEGDAAAAVPSYIHDEQTYYTPLPIFDRRGGWVATAIIAFGEQQVKALLNEVRNATIRMIGAILLGSVLLLIVALNLIPTFDTHQQRLSKMRVGVIMLLVIGAAQIVFSVLNTRDFGEYYLQISQKKSRTLATLLKEDIEFLLSKGIRVDKLVKMDVLMGEIIEASPELLSIKIVDSDGLPLYMATQQEVVDFQKATDEEFRAAYRQLPATTPDYTLSLDLTQDDERVGVLSTHLSRKALFKRLAEIALDSATILVISMLFFVELLILIILFIDRRVSHTKEPSGLTYAMIRPAAFLFLFGVDISISFLPLYMEKLYEPIFGMSKDMLMGLPISVRMFFTGISFSIAGTWIDRRGWREPFISGLIMTGLGILYSWQAPDAIQFILSRGLFGLGYGFALMAAQGFVITHTDDQTKARGLAELFAGVYAGSICGGAAGAMVAERIGYSPVFLLGSIIIFSIIGYTLIFMRHTGPARKTQAIAVEKDGGQPSEASAWRFLGNRNVLSVIVLATIPAAIAVIGLLNYFSPIYLNRIGASQSNIGRIFMIYGISLIYIAPYLSKFVDTSNNKKLYIFISGLLGSAAFLSFFLLGGYAATIVAVSTLGVAASFGGARRAYILRLDITQRLGSGKSLGLFNSTARIGQVLGPITIGWLVGIFGVNKGITYLGVAYLVATMLFYLFAKSDKTFDIST